mmetsp:Transcript_44067/g.108178  ORF Transcript_44067/g.108178 Transcript_44067/m.108178 type:complete len:87 (-) Transcript_44067:468-728(-)
MALLRDLPTFDVTSFQALEVGVAQRQPRTCCPTEDVALPPSGVMRESGVNSLVHDFINLSAHSPDRKRQAGSQEARPPSSKQARTQ